jgi:hypothetical protein
LMFNVMAFKKLQIFNKFSNVIIHNLTCNTVLLRNVWSFENILHSMFRPIWPPSTVWNLIFEGNICAFCYYCLAFIHPYAHVSVTYNTFG